MDIMEEILPINPDDWEAVQIRHEQAYPYNRTVVSLQRVFNDLARVTEPTGDPNIPPAVKRAKVLRHQLREKTDGTTGSPDADDLVLGLGDEEEEEDVVEQGAGEDDNEEEGNEEEGDDLAELFDSRTGGDYPSVVRARTVNRRSSPTGGGSVASATLSASAAAAAAVASSKTAKKVPSQSAKNAHAAFDRRTSGTITVPAASPKFTAQLMSMNKQRPATGASKNSHSVDSGFSFQNMMGMMMMQQQQERDSIREDRAFQAEQLKMEREERAQQAREDRAQQQQMMTMMMMTMMGGGKRARGRDYSDDDDADDDLGQKKKSPRKSPRKGN